MKLQKIALALSIAIVFNALLFFMGVVLFGRPEYKDFCQEDGHKYRMRASCEEVGFEWNQNLNSCEPSRAYRASCQEKLEQAWSHYDDRMLTLRVAAGTMALIVGLFTALGGISPGFILGGLASIAIGCWEYWTWNHPYLKLTALSIALVFLVISGYYKFGSNKKTAD